MPFIESSGTEMAEVVVIASYMRDVSAVVARFPVPGETLVGTNSLEAHGGKGSNQAIQAARSGAAVEIVAAIGADDAGRSALDCWQREGLGADTVSIKPTSATGLALILVEQGGQNQIVIIPGANLALNSQDVDRARRAIESARLVVAQLETPIEATAHAFEIARSRGVLTLLNAAPAPEAFPARLANLVDLLIVNEIEGAAIAGLPVDADPLIMAEALLALTRLGVVVTLGAGGAIYAATNGDRLRCDALPVEVVDTTGAGDAFVGAFAARWAALSDSAPEVMAGTTHHATLNVPFSATHSATHQGADALARGVAAGSLACTARGAIAARHDARLLEREAGRLSPEPWSSVDARGTARPVP
jgi:ribokinase